jgi:hypothetical protein
MNTPPPPSNPIPETPVFKLPALSRRQILIGTGLAALGFMLGCEKEKRDSVVAELPEWTPDYSYIRRQANVSETGDYAPKQPSNLPVKPTVQITPPENNTGIIPRSYWAKDGPDMKRVDPLGEVKLITFHHSGDPKVFTSSDFSETAHHLESVRAYHRSRNFQDIGYHFAIDRAGRVWQLRSLKYQGQHVRYNNENNVGVVVMGNFDLQDPTEAQKKAILSFGIILRKQFKLPIKRVYTHQEIVSTDCPGKGMQPYMVQVRKQGLI